MIYLYYLITIIIGYLIGSLNFSIIIGKLFYKTDVREHGSKNAGATNTLRTLGTVPGLVVFVLDTLKAVIAFLIVSLIPYGMPVSGYLAAAAASLGHNYPVFFGFKGGKGVTVSLGMLFCFSPVVGILTLGVGVLVIFFTRYVSLGSMLATLVSPLFTIFFFKGECKPLVFTLNLLLAVQIILRHKSNIRKLLNGNESKISFSKKGNRK